MNNSILESNNPGDINTQRISLLEKNPDRLFGVYNLVSDTNGIITLELVPNTLCLYPNQMSTINGYQDDSNISLLDINSLRQGIINVIKGSNINIKNPILLSGGSIEIVGNTNIGNLHIQENRDRILLTLRDGGAADTNQYTSVAGRNTGENLDEEIDREQTEESPFLMTDENGNYFLGIRNNTPENIKILEASIRGWIEKINLYTSSVDTDKQTSLTAARKYLKKAFPEVHTLEPMIDILSNIVERKAYTEYNYETIDTYPGIEDSIKTIQIGSYAGQYYVFHDENNNTIEYKRIDRITGIPAGYTLAGRGTSRLYLESINQYPRIQQIHGPGGYIEAKNKKLVPVVRAFVEAILLARTKLSIVSSDSAV